MKIVESSLNQWSAGLTETERLVLWQIAMDSLNWGVMGTPGSFAFDDYRLTPSLKEPRATFVTFKTGDGELRGCMGSLLPQSELFRSVHENTLNAALRDPRFPNIEAGEVEQLHMSISILSKPEIVTGPEKFIPGQHGVIFEKQGQRAVFLPEVALEQQWSREETFNALCQKAGLPADAWLEGGTVYLFATAHLMQQS